MSSKLYHEEHRWRAKWSRIRDSTRVKANRSRFSNIVGPWNSSQRTVWILPINLTATIYIKQICYQYASEWSCNQSMMSKAKSKCSGDNIKFNFRDGEVKCVLSSIPLLTYHNQEFERRSCSGRDRSMNIESLFVFDSRAQNKLVKIRGIPLSRDRLWVIRSHHIYTFAAISELSSQQISNFIFDSDETR